MSSYTKSSSFNRRALTSVAIEMPRSSSSTAFISPVGSAFTSPRTHNFGASPRPLLKKISHLFQLLIITGTLVSFLVIITGGNGRGHEEYLKWRWKPKHCHVPRFQVRDVLERLRSKRIVFVGDSLSRTQWESLIFMLITGLDDKSSVYEVFLVQHGRLHWHAPKRVNSTLKLDILDVINQEWSSADYLIFNTGQCGCYFQVGNSLRLGMSIPAAYRVALKTWASWIMTTIDPNKTHVLIRTFELSHWGYKAKLT
ncbi:unnamed protein product [Brassica oleracea]